MKYEITAKGPAGATSVRARNEHEAYSQGYAAEADGNTDVRIWAPNGEVFGVREFYQQVIVQGRILNA